MLGVLLVLGIAFAFYHFSHVSRQAEVLRARNLRELVLLARQVEDLLEESRSSVKGLSPSCLSWLRGSVWAPCWSLARSTRDLSSWRLLTGPLRGNPLRVSSAIDDPRPPVQLETQQEGKRLTIRVAAQELVLSLEMDFDRYLSLPVDLFDHLLLIDSGGRVLHQDTQPGIRFASLGLKEAFPQRSHQQQLTVAGRDFTLFAQPLVLRGARLTQEPSEQSWFVAGLVSTARLKAESTVLTPTTLLLLSCLLALLVFSLPVLKIWVSKSHERVRRVDLLGLGVASVLAMALIAILVADLFTYRPLLRASDQTLKGIADEIRRQSLQEMEGRPDRLEALKYLRSKIEAGLPPNVYFTFLDAAGRTLVHSDPRRDRYESLLVSCEHDGRLLEALRTPRTQLESPDGPEPFTVTYQGHPHRMIVTSLDRHPLWLAVFYDKEPLQRFHLDLLLWILGIALVYVGVVVGLTLLLALGWYFARRRRDGLIGSGEAFQEGDWSLLGVLGLLAGTLLWSLFDPSLSVKLSAAVSIPLVALTFYLARLVWKRKGRARSRWQTFLPLATWAVALVLIVWLVEESSLGRDLTRFGVTGALLGLGAYLWLRKHPENAETVPATTTRRSKVLKKFGVVFNTFLFLLVVVALPIGLLFEVVWQAEHWSWVARGQRYFAARAEGSMPNPQSAALHEKFFGTRFERKACGTASTGSDGKSREEAFQWSYKIWKKIDRLHRNLPLQEYRQLTMTGQPAQTSHLLYNEDLIGTGDASRVRLHLGRDRDGKCQQVLSAAKPPGNKGQPVPYLAGLLGLLCLVVIGWSARKLLVIDFGSGGSPMEPPDQDDHLLWIGDSDSLEAVFPKSHRCEWVDLGAPGELERLTTGKRKVSDEVPRVVLQGFEKLRDEPRKMTSLFEQLAAWVARDNLALVLASAEEVSPAEVIAAFPADEDASPNDTGNGTPDTPRVERLRSLLASFTFYDTGALGLPGPGPGNLTPEELDGWRLRRAKVWLQEESQTPRLDRAARWIVRSSGLRDMSRSELEQAFEAAVCFYYQWAWSRCTKREKRVLFQLAEEGMINPAAGEIGRRLLRRGLATLPPHRGLRPMNETFRRWIRKVGQREKLREEEKQLAAQEGGWPEVRNPILLALALLSIFLLTTQQHLVAPTLGQVHQSFGQIATLFTALAGGIAGMAQLVWRATSSGG